jgi:hypothetical protein
MKKLNNYSLKSMIISCIILSFLFTSSSEVASQFYNPPCIELSCTNFAASFGERVLFGNSEDGGLSHPLSIVPLDTQMFYYSEDSEGYGCAFVGWYWEGGISIQGGMNDQGLCYDLTGIPDTPVNTPPNPTYTVAGSWIMKDILRLNANVSELIDFVLSCDWSGHWWYQWLFADAHGDIVIISPGIDGDLVFTRKVAGENGFLTQTNFNRANNESGTYPCWRYEASYESLSEIESEEDLTPTKFNEVLEEVHFPKRGGSFTHYSNAFDPVNQMLYLNYMGQFDETAEINVTEELDFYGSKAVPMVDYFTEETAEEGYKSFKNWKRTAIFIYRFLPIAAIVLIAAGIAVGIYFLVKKLKRRKVANKE